MNVYDIPEPPVDPPEREPLPECPVCGEETDAVYRDRWGNIVGCPECVEMVFDWE